MKLEKQFPDCQAWEINGSSERKLVRIEFELRASNFAAHKHDVNGCDLIVCWEDDWPNCEIERLSLKPEIPAFDLRIIQSPSRVKYPPQVWTYETFLKSVADHPDQHREFLNWAVALRGNSSVTFGEGNQLPSWSFTVCLSSGRHVTLFGVYPDGTEWLQPQAFPTRSARFIASRSKVLSMNGSLLSSGSIARTRYGTLPSSAHFNEQPKMSWARPSKDHRFLNFDNLAERVQKYTPCIF